ncbi:MAG: creatininase [Planctomycetes bacterium]|nr:creatininase [Planctomycetota bacterium]
MPLLEEMTWPEIDQAVREEKVLIFIVGATEQHGPHLPVGVDSFIPEGVMRKVADLTGAVLAPVMPYGFKSNPRSGGGEGFQGTYSLNGATVIAVVRDILSAFMRKGWKNIFVLNWHYENVEFVHEGINLARDDSGGAATFVVLDNPNALVDQAILDDLFAGDFPGWDREHAAIFETSMMYAVRPDLVREDLIRDDEPTLVLPYSVYPPPAKTVPESGVLWHASKASRRLGLAVFESMVAAIAAILQREFSGEQE